MATTGTQAKEAQKTDNPSQEEDAPKKDELQSRVLKGGVTYEPGTKVSDLKLSDDEKDRLKRLGVTE